MYTVVKNLKVAGISFGSSERDKTAEIRLHNTFTVYSEGIVIDVSRKGTDGNKEKAKALYTSLDGKVDAIGIGGTDLYFVLEKSIYTMRDTVKVIEGVKNTPVVDGSGIKLTREPDVAKWIFSDEFRKEHDIDLSKYCRSRYDNHSVFMTCAVDRYAMAKEFSKKCHVVYGDFMMNLNMNLPITNLKNVIRLAKVLLPYITRKPIEKVYPLGEKQTENTPKFVNYFHSADIIAGDWHFVGKYAPTDLENKIIVTNTTTEENVEFLKQRGAYLLITTTPLIDGRTFGTNVFESMAAAILGNKTRENTHPKFGYDDYAPIIGCFDKNIRGYEEFRPSVRILNAA